MKRTRFKFIFTLLILSIILSSCEDIFHDAGSILESVRENNDSNSQHDPQKIIIGGYFKYNYNGVDHEALAVLDGNGEFVEGALDHTAYGIYGDGAGYWGIHDMELTADTLYVAGNFQGYASTSAYTSFDNKYKMLMRFNYDGASLSHDSLYIPANDPTLSSSIYSIQLLNDNSLVIGGDFYDSGGPWINRFTVLDSVGTVDGGLVLDSTVNDLFYIAEENILLVAGHFSSVNALPDFYQGFVVVNMTTDEIFPPGSFLLDSPDDPLIITEISDIELSDNDGVIELFIGGQDYNAPSPPVGNTLWGVLRKYVFNGTQFVSDSAFNSRFHDVELSRDAESYSLYFDNVYTITTDSKGFIYLGGSFSGIKDLNNNEHKGIMRLTSNGMIDPTFNPEISDDMNTPEIYDIQIQANGKILVAGQFYDGRANGILRLTADGNIDESFHRYALPSDPMINTPAVYSIIIEEEPEE